MLVAFFGGAGGLAEGAMRGGHFDCRAAEQGLLQIVFCKKPFDAGDHVFDISACEFFDFAMTS